MGSVLRRCVIVLTCALGIGACSGSEGATPDSLPAPVPTVPGVGRLPAPLPTAAVAAREDDEPVVPSVVVTRPVDEDGVVLETVAERVNGNRLLVVGDEILASTATRYGDEMCDALTPLGWEVEVEAEPGRFVEFGREVVEDRLPDDVDEADDWDAAVVQVGNNYSLDQDDYFEQLNEILFRLSPRPTLVLTVTELRPESAEVNESIAELAGLYDNVTVIDWAEVADQRGVLLSDGLHPAEQGQQVLADQIALALGQVSEDEGECLSSVFTDDSAVDEESASPAGPFPDDTAPDSDSESTADDDPGS